MTWLTPLGFLGLIGLVVLILIYIIKPNYQQKFISSTYVWKKSLKYKKKKMPINRLQDILLFLCQVLIITGMASILAQPFIMADKEQEYKEHVVIIDASASMLSTTEQGTRFERAVSEVRTLAEQVMEEEGKMTVILAGEKASYVVQDAGAEFKTELFAALEALSNTPAEEICTYGEGDLEGAIKLAEEITSETKDVQVLLYTDTQYIDSGRVTVKQINDEREWNAAILDVRAIVVENYYRFEVDVACYGNKDADINIAFDIYGVNESNATISLDVKARCKAGQTETLVFGNYSADEPDETITEDVEVFAYNYAVARVDELDTYDLDNTFYLYGGAKQMLKISTAAQSPTTILQRLWMLSVTASVPSGTWSIRRSCPVRSTLPKASMCTSLSMRPPRPSRRMAW
jgi:hypothetical protein